VNNYIHSAAADSKIAALIPLRGGSKRIPRKNIKLIAGKPLAYWVCLAATRSRFISRTYVSTDSPEIADTVERFDLGIDVLHRAPELSGDQVSTEAVLLDATHRVEHFDILATLQATSPLTSEKHLDEAITMMLDQGLDSLVTGTSLKRFVWSLDGVPLNYDFRRRPFSQDFKGSMVENGAFYLTRREVLEKDRSRLGGRIGVYVMPEANYTELDHPEDWPVVEALLKRRTCLAERLSGIKAIFSDFDGVWTDNTVFVDDQGRESLRFTKEDSLGLDTFRQRLGIPVTVVSKERNPIVAVRCKKLCLPLLQAVDDKVAAVESRIAEMGLRWEEICFIGNDVNDVPCLKRAGFSVCPSDAAREVLPLVDFVLARPGGHGAMRELFNLFGGNQHDA
jgi:YrbI family 3-deoxy-D-manno-octulosonate 8-phosphate phosphatase